MFEEIRGSTLRSGVKFSSPSHVIMTVLLLSKGMHVRWHRDIKCEMRVNIMPARKETHLFMIFHIYISWMDIVDQVHFVYHNSPMCYVFYIVGVLINQWPLAFSHFPIKILIYSIKKSLIDHRAAKFYKTFNKQLPKQSFDWKGITA